MTLTSWLSKSKTSDADFALRIGVTRQALWRYKFAGRIPKPEIIARISEATNGRVTANDFVFVAKPAVVAASKAVSA
jgi:transcriptional regulator with XRE-family HTH domain